MQGVQRLFCAEFKALGGGNTQATLNLNNYDKANSTSLFIAKKKKKEICFIVGVAYKTLFSSYSVIISYLGEGSSEKNRCW